MSASTGLLFFDFILRPFLKIGMKFPVIGFLFLFACYGFVAYLVLRSTYHLEDFQ
jgi:hypothetical protein